MVQLGSGKGLYAVENSDGVMEGEGCLSHGKPMGNQRGLFWLAATWVSDHLVLLKWNLKPSVSKLVLKFRK